MYLDSNKKRHKKRHGQVEREQRIDSFETQYRSFQIGSDFLPFGRTDDKITVLGERLQLNYVHNAAGRLTFFLCPGCGRRVRFLYLPQFRCRSCSRLNYRCQQTTKGSHADVSAIPTKMGVQGPEAWETDYSLPRPRYMHRTRYARLKQRFEKKMLAFDARRTTIIRDALEWAEL